MKHGKGHKPDSSQNSRSHDKRTKREKSGSGRAGASRRVKRGQGESKKPEPKKTARDSQGSSPVTLVKEDGTIDFLASGRATAACIRIQQILGSKEFVAMETVHPLFRSGIIELIIHLRDLLRLSDGLDKQLTWSNDITPCNDVGGYKNVEELIVFFRHGVVHSHTWHRRFGSKTGAPVNLIAYGRKGWIIKVGDRAVGSDYDDDVAVFIGHHRIYLKRHMIRAFHELQQTLRRAGIDAGPMTP